MNVDLIALVGLISTIVGIILGILGYKKKSETDIREDTQKETILSTKLDYISKNVDDIKLDLKSKVERDAKIAERIVKIEESLKVAHHRIEDLEKKEGM